MGILQVSTFCPCTNSMPKEKSCAYGKCITEYRHKPPSIYVKSQYICSCNKWCGIMWWHLVLLLHAMNIFLSCPTTYF